MEKLTYYLNDYFGQLIRLIHSHGGDVVKFAGDALLAVWPTDDEVQIAIRANYELLRHNSRRWSYWLAHAQ